MQLPDVRRLTIKQLYALFSQGDLHKLSMGELQAAGVMEPSIWGKIIGVSSTGTLVWLPQDSTGRMPIVEQNSSTISSRVLDGAYWGMAAAPPSFGRSTVSSTAPYLRRGVLAVDATCTAGGELSATTLVPAVAGYTGYCYIEKVWSDQTDAGATITVTGGTPTPFTIVTAANTVTELGIWLQGSAANTAISIAAAAGQFGASQVLQIQGTYHYEP